MGENPRHSSCVNRSSTRSPTNSTQVSTSSPPPGDLCTPAFQIEEQLNEFYEKRIAEIEQQADGDASLKEVTYVEWIEMLRQVNKTLIMNIQEMERETSERLVLLQRKVGTNCRQDSELTKYRNDVSRLIQLVRNGRNGDWSVDKFQFETIKDHDIFGNEESYDDQLIRSEAEAASLPCAVDEKANIECQRAKLTANVKALAFEVAEKHDEIRDLKKQILSMEDEIQKAQKKILLKDDVIKELRNDLKSLPKCNNLWGVRVVERTPPSSGASKMSIKSTDVSAISRPGEAFSNRESINTPNCGSSNVCNISLPDDDAEEEVFKFLEEELLNYDQDADEQRRASKEQQGRLHYPGENLLKSYFEIQSKLKLYRRELIVLENPQSDSTLTNCSDVDSGICADSDVDVKIINSVRGRFGCLMEENQRLIREQQNIQINYQEVNSRALAKTELLDKASKVLREVAEALSAAISQPISYVQLFGDSHSLPVNPFVEAVDKLIENLQEKDKMIHKLRKQISEKSNQEPECCSDNLTTDMCDVKEPV